MSVALERLPSQTILARIRIDGIIVENVRKDPSLMPKFIEALHAEAEEVKREIVALVEARS